MINTMILFFFIFFDLHFDSEFVNIYYLTTFFDFVLYD